MAEKTSEEKKKEPAVHKGVLFGPPEKTGSTLVLRGAKTRLIYGFIPGEKTLVHEEDVKDFLKRDFKKEE